MPADPSAATNVSGPPPGSTMNAMAKATTSAPRHIEARSPEETAGRPGSDRSTRSVDVGLYRAERSIEYRCCLFVSHALAEAKVPAQPTVDSNEGLLGQVIGQGHITAGQPP